MKKSPESTILELFKLIEGLWCTVKQSNWNPASSGELQDALHKLAGKSGSYGFTQINLSAKNFEKNIRDCNPSNPLSDTQINKLDAQFQELEQIINHLKPISPSNSLNNSGTGFHNSFNKERSNQLIYLIHEDSDMAEDISIQIGYFGYKIKLFSNLTQANSHITQEPPSAIILDSTFKKEELDNLRKNLPKQTSGFEIPIIFLSDSDEINHRLEAVRAGGEAYFTNPIEIVNLIDALDRSFNYHNHQPYRVLLVEDSRFQATYYAKTLESVGMQTRITTNPLKIIQVLNEFNPDLILLDMYMPSCTGMELARVIRQMEKFVSIPIVFLSAETDKDKQLHAMSLGGDDFLAKPIKPEHLISSVSSRVARYQKLRSMMIRDGLTGLFNHTSIKQQLEHEILRAGRQKNSTFSFAMLDLDLFKKINDTYGHLTGDQVLKSLARFLLQRLRQTDIIGRYGGEEFAIIFPDTKKECVAKVMNELRDGFSKIRHHMEEAQFLVTFSCGIAAYPDFLTASEINEAADQALYEAKRQGRNKVVVYSPKE